MQRGAEVETLTHRGRTALHLAALHGRAGCVRLLLRYGANPQRTDLSGATPLDLARDAGHESCADALAPVSAPGPRFACVRSASPSLPHPPLLPPSSQPSPSKSMSGALHAAVGARMGGGGGGGGGPAEGSSEPSAELPPAGSGTPSGSRLLRSREALAAELALAL